METNYNKQQIRTIRRDVKAQEADAKAQGFTDIITVTEMGGGIHRVSGIYKSGQIGGNSIFKTLAQYCKAKYGAGVLQQLGVSHIQGRRAVKYGVR